MTTDTTVAQLIFITGFLLFLWSLTPSRPRGYRSSGPRVTELPRVRPAHRREDVRGAIDGDGRWFCPEHSEWHTANRRLR